MVARSLLSGFDARFADSPAKDVLDAIIRPKPAPRKAEWPPAGAGRAGRPPAIAAKLMVLVVHLCRAIGVESVRLVALAVICRYDSLFDLSHPGENEQCCQST